MAQRDLVFISYAHEDRKWLADLQTFLKPFEKQGKLQVWADPHIAVGARWHREINAALARTRVGVALVTQDFVASDFIVDEELPALLAAIEAADAVIVAIPVSAATHEVLGLDEYQWAWPPDMPLDQLSRPKRNKALVLITRQIVDAAAVDHEEGEVPSRAGGFGPDAGAVSLVSDGGDVGRLYGVPDQRPNFVPRIEDRDRVVSALLGDRFAVGVTGASRVGVHGQGGIGKSVLAIDVVGQEVVRRAFPDGVFWLTVGQSPKLLDLQTQLAKLVTGDDVAIGSVPAGVAVLKSVFAGKRALLVLDDLWAGHHAAAFDVLTPGCRLLVTTRDRGVVADVGAREERLEVLSDEAARVLLAEWVGVASSELPDEADGLIAETGNLPLAISLAGARIADGVAWADVLGALREGKLDYLDHPYGSVFASMQLSMDALADDDRARLVELAVFPEDEHVPESVITRLWAQTGGLTAPAGVELLEAFERQALLYLGASDDRSGVSFHDLQHDFLRLSADDPVATHRQLVAAYWPAGADLPAIPASERYMWERIGYHLAEAGMVERLRALLLDPAWLRAKLAATDVAALLEDFDAAPIDEDVARVGAALRKSSHAIGKDPAQLPGQLLGRLSSSVLAGVQSLCDNIGRAACGRWLRPAAASLIPPGIGEVMSLTGHTDWVTAVAVTPDGTQAITGSDDGTVRVWDLASATETAQLDGHIDWVTAVAVTPDGTQAITGSGDGTVRVWDLASATEAAQLVGHVGGVYAVAVTPDGTQAITGSRDGTVRVWDLASATETAQLVGHVGGVYAVAVTPDGTQAITGSDDGTMRVWNLASATETTQLDGHTGRVNAVAVTPDGTQAITGGTDGTVRVWGLASATETAQLDGHTDWVRAVAVTPDGTQAITGGGDGTVRVWDLASATETARLDGHTGRVNAVAVTPDGTQAITGGDDGTVRVWDLASGPETAQLDGHIDWVTAVAVTPDGTQAITGGGDGTVRVWDLASATETAQLVGHTDWVNAVAVTPDGTQAITGGRDGTVRVWDLASATETAQLVGHVGGVYAVAVTPDGTQAITGSDDGTMRVWNLASGTETAQLVGHVGGVTAVAVTPDGTQAITGGRDGTVRVWDLASATETAQLVGHTDWVNAVAVTPDGTQAITGSDDGTVRVWDLASATETAQLVGHTGRVNAVAVTPDGTQAITGGDDGTVRVWDLASRASVAAFTADGWVLAVAVGTLGRSIVAGDSAGRTHAMRLEDA